MATARSPPLSVRACLRFNHQCGRKYASVYPWPRLHPSRTIVCMLVASVSDDSLIFDATGLNLDIAIFQISHPR